ncbi:LLM class flavin-dependent oxidoreductase [Actinomadura sp. B10D3]|uniref:LLM class flavin-dependent oxidoreductase n=1 Tax=Actinomadura sp. B10D3 TaxID=3153557 RepID=UPI00325DFBCC
MVPSTTKPKRARRASESAMEVERAGYGTLWLDASPPADLAFAEKLLDATTRMAVGTSVVNVWTADAETVAASYHRIVARHPGRFILGVGIGHREVHAEWASPYDTLVPYLDRLAQAVSRPNEWCWPPSVRG